MSLTFRNEIEDHYPACGIIPTPWRNEEDTKLSESEWIASNNEEEVASDFDHSVKRDLGARRIQVPFTLYSTIKEMFYILGPRQVTIEEKTGKSALVRKALDWDGKVIPNLLVTDAGRFFIKYDERGPGVIVEFMPTINNRSVNIHGGKLKCAAVVYRTFTRRTHSTSLAVPFQIQGCKWLELQCGKYSACHSCHCCNQKDKEQLSKIYSELEICLLYTSDAADE